MVVRLAQEPAEGARLVGETYAQIAPRHGRLLGFIGPRPAVPAATRPIQVWTIPVGEISSEAPLAHARSVGWRYLVRDGEKLVTVDLRSSADEKLRFGALRRGGGQRLAQACAVAADTSRADEVLEMRLLSLPSLHIEGLWLAGGDDDRFIRLRSPGSAKVEPFDLLAEAHAAAARRVDTRPPQDDERDR